MVNAPPTVQAVTLPVGQCNAQEAIPAGVPGYSSKGAYNFDQALVKGSTTFKVPSTDYSRIQQDAYLENANQDVRHSPARSNRASQVGMQKKMQNIALRLQTAPKSACWLYGHIVLRGTDQRSE